MEPSEAPVSSRLGALVTASVSTTPAIRSLASVTVP